MSIGKLQASLAAATNEVTVAAASINFDFTLVKYEAPKEYRLLGELLSTKRKHDAESGAAHITARRLGSLFEGVCPPTPNLIKAYGKRVSEIAESAASKTPVDYSKSIFASYSGVDATSIWAAATSSKAAIPVHLLNCMLARVFEAPEAISIWVELVKEQRQNIAGKLEDGESLPFSLAAAAAQQEIPRSQLAEWDASARAWLRTADGVMERKQTQLRLVLKNIALPVNQKTAVFASVIEAWKSALTTMDNLISGSPQAVNDGAAIIGLSAWHLYPDMTVFGTQIVEISMRDDLISAGGILSLGLSSTANNTSPGVYWCLSLTSLRYYGHPVRSERQLDADPKRVSFSQFQLAVLGVVLGTWKIPIKDTKISIQIILSMGNLLQQEFNTRTKDKWVEMLTQPALAYLAAKGDDKEIASRLLHLGRRRASDFVPPHMTKPDLPFFGLLDTICFFRCLRDNEARIMLLRRIATRVPELSKELTILRCCYNSEESIADSDSELEDYSDSASEMEVDQPQTDETPSPENILTKDTIFYATLFSQVPAFLEDSQFFNDITNRGCHHRWLPELHFQATPEEEHAHQYSPGMFESEMMFVHSHGQTLDFLFGDTSTVAIFVKRQETSSKFFMNSPRITSDDIAWCFDSRLVSAEKLECLIADWSSPIYKTLSCLSMVSSIYASLSDATLNVESLNRPFINTEICKDGNHGDGTDIRHETLSRFMTRMSSMGVVAYFEGGHDIGNSALASVIAISAGDSIYVPKQLVCDPLEPSQDYELRRILGNVGKPGVVMLVSPQTNLMVRDIDLSTWKFSCHKEFDGRAEDCFAGTSLHLSFTDYHVPFFQSHSRGQKDSQLSMLESVISIRDSGIWVAGLDILRALREGPIYRIPPQNHCEHAKDSAPSKPLVSVECWNDILDLQDGRLIIKAQGNWVARLAATALLAQNPKRPATRISICPSNLCWKCLSEEHEFNVYIF